MGRVYRQTSKTAAALAAVFIVVGCRPSPSACVATYTDRSGTTTVTACREDADRSACAVEIASSFSPGRTCADVGFPCLHDAWGAVLLEARDAHGACPPGTSPVR